MGCCHSLKLNKKSIESNGSAQKLTSIPPSEPWNPDKMETIKNAESVISKEDIDLFYNRTSLLKSEIKHIYLVRHGQRLDDISPDEVKRPYDPPLSTAGFDQSVQLGRDMFSGLRINKVLTSPFLRCVQTAISICDGMGYTGLIYIDNSLSEIHNNRVIKGASSETKITLPWEELDKLYPNRIAPPTTDDNPMPQWGETFGFGGTAHIRYAEALYRIASSKDDNIVVVTHGGAVGTWITEVRKNVIVYKTDYCACAHFVKTGSTIKLMNNSGEGGVEWVS